MIGLSTTQQMGLPVMNPYSQQELFCLLLTKATLESNLQFYLSIHLRQFSQLPNQIYKKNLRNKLRKLKESKAMERITPQRFKIQLNFKNVFVRQKQSLKKLQFYLRITSLLKFLSPQQWLITRSTHLDNKSVQSKNQNQKVAATPQL